MARFRFQPSLGYLALLAASTAFSYLGCVVEGSGGTDNIEPTSSKTSTSTSSSSGMGGNTGTTATAGVGGGGGDGLPAFPCGDDVDAPAVTLPDVSDPEAGDFTLAEALDQLPAGMGPLTAYIETDMGTLRCELFPNAAPIGVANFVGLARGRRAWLDPVSKKWVKRRFYDGLLFHRVIPNFMAQGGDPLGTGYGGPGYQFKNEIAGKSHVPGTLAYANAGPDTNGSQFYITETDQSGLDPDYTIFGLCDPVSVVSALTHVKTSGPPNDKPLTDLHTKKITITQCPPP